MANMSYCRFHNTLHALRDCHENWDSETLSDEEIKAKKDMINLIMYIVSDHEEDFQELLRSNE